MQSDNSSWQHSLWVHAWVDTLSKILGWPEHAVIQWAERHANDIAAGENAEFNRETPSYYIAPLFVPEELRTRFDGQSLMRLLWQIQESIAGTSGSTLHYSDQDWEHARERIEVVLRGYGASLAGIPHWKDRI